VRLFSKTLLFFISIIIFQSALIVFLITNIVKKINLEDSKNELTNEASIVYEGYNSWKRNLWINIIGLKNDEQLSSILKNYKNISFYRKLIPYLKEKLYTSGADCLILKSNITVLEIISTRYNMFFLSDVENLIYNRPHPYIETKFLGNTLSMIGAVRISMKIDQEVDLFLIKTIDENFCNYLTLNRNSKASFILNNSTISGQFEEFFSEGFDLENITSFDSAYKEFFNLEIGKNSYNLALQKAGNIKIQENEKILHLATIVPNSPYLRRLSLINKAVLYVSGLSGLFTIIVSLFLSRNISKPVKKLLSAIHHIRNGKYNVDVKDRSGKEMRELLQGFNQMALKLQQDKTQMENFIQEILILKDYNEKIVHSIGAGIAIVNREFVIEKANNSFLKYFGLEEKSIVGKKIPGLDIAISREIMEGVKAIIDQKSKYYSKIIRTDSRKVYEIKIYPFFSTNKVSRNTSSCVCIVEDISKKIELEEKIFQAEKLSTISMLSAGVAHEINNPLSSIMTNVQNLISDERNMEKLVSLRWIEQETRRIASIVRELLNFSSTRKDNVSWSEPDKVILNTINLIEYSIKKEENINIELRLEKNCPPIAISEDELKQVIINIVKNSLQAVKKGEIIRITTTIMNNEKEILISIEDNGCGIREDILPYIFDPFFTTKNNGDGTGLGLSVVYGIINKNRGRINIQSKEGEGTTVSIFLPFYVQYKG